MQTQLDDRQLAYLEGFVQKCAEAGVDPEAVLAHASGVQKTAAGGVGTVLSALANQGGRIPGALWGLGRAGGAKALRGAGAAKAKGAKVLEALREALSGKRLGGAIDARQTWQLRNPHSWGATTQGLDRDVLRELGRTGGAYAGVGTGLGGGAYGIGRALSQGSRDPDSGAE